MTRSSGGGVCVCVCVAGGGRGGGGRLNKTSHLSAQSEIF